MKPLKIWLFILVGLVTLEMVEIYIKAHAPTHDLPPMLSELRRLEMAKNENDEILNTNLDAAKTKPNFGRTHFIVGYDDYDRELADADATGQSPATQMDEPLSDAICIDENGKLCSALFAPDHNLRAALRQLIKHEQESISIAVFAFTDAPIARELLNAHKRGVKIEVLVDPSCLRSQHQKIDLLSQAGIQVYVYKAELSKGPSSIMHNKFALFSKTVKDKKILWTGSFNFTKSGSDFNQENVLMLDDTKIIQQYADQFIKLKERTEKLRRPSKTAVAFAKDLGMKNAPLLQFLLSSKSTLYPI